MYGERKSKKRKSSDALDRSNSPEYTIIRGGANIGAGGSCTPYLFRILIFFTVLTPLTFNTLTPHLQIRVAALDHNVAVQGFDGRKRWRLMMVSDQGC